MLKTIERVLAILGKILAKILKGLEAALKTIAKASKWATNKLTGQISSEKKEYMQAQKEKKELQVQQDQINAKIESNKSVKEELVKEEAEEKVKELTQKKMASGFKVAALSVFKTVAALFKHSAKLLGSSVKVLKIGLDRGVEVLDTKVKEKDEKDKKEKKEKEEQKKNQDLQNLSVVTHGQTENTVINSVKQKTEQNQLN